MFDSWGEHEERPSAGAVTTIGSSGRDPLLEGLPGIAPGVDLGSALASIDRRGVSGPDQVFVMQAWSRQVAHAQAELYASMVAVAEAEAEVAGPFDELADIHDLAASEIQAALSWTRRAAEFQLGLAEDLVARHPRVWAALHRGLIDLPKARVIIDQTSHLDQEIAWQVADVALERAGTQTTGQLRARIQRLVMAVDPDSARERYEVRLLDRRVAIEATEAGTANLFGMDLPAADTSAAMRRINRLARSAKTADDHRTLDQIRADILLDLLNGRDPNQKLGVGAVVDIRVDLTTLAGLDNNPAEIPGWGPVIADVARQVVKEQDKAEWRITVTDRDTGRTIHVGTTRRRPTTSQRRKVEAVALTCVFPGCRMPARDSDIDHRKAWTDGGPTQEDNLEPLCRHDHRLKHAGWKLEKTVTDEYLWTSPLGLKYTVDPRAP
ncbi:MAG TPA: DUF222 domain-containing protein [Acidimicrobiia bacterium]|nr:DUF222 domain-containing protein [Acidimicrobiia bacterium]